MVFPPPTLKLGAKGSRLRGEAGSVQGKGLRQRSDPPSTTEPEFRLVHWRSRNFALNVLVHTEYALNEPLHHHWLRHLRMKKVGSIS